MTPTLDAIKQEYRPEFRAEAARRWLSYFCALMDPAYVNAAHTTIVCDHLQAVERGEIDRLALFMPPRHSKTYHVSQRFPAWYLGRHPDHQVILASYGADLAEANSRVVRNLLQDQRYPFDVRVAADSSAVNRWATDQKGVVLAAGVGGAMTGFGGNILIIDDPVKGREEADSETYRERAWEWYTDVARTRLMPGGAIVLCQTRWHEDDLSGRAVIANKDRWCIVDMPALNDAGEALWPEWYGAEQLAEIKYDIGSRAWNALYQQKPTADEGGMFKRAWFTQRYAEMPRLPYVVLSVDSSFKDGIMNDYSVIATWGSDGVNYYLLDIWRARVEYPELKAAILGRAGMMHPQAIYIEDTAAGIVASQELRRETALPIIPVKVTASKESRAAAVTPLCEARKVMLPTGAAWVDEWINEHASFPTGTHDDQVDTTSMALAKLKQNIPIPQASPAIVTSSSAQRRNDHAWWQEPVRAR